VFTQAIALCVFTQQFPGFGAIGHAPQITRIEMDESIRLYPRHLWPNYREFVAR
jgi:hypothetical protein